MTKRQEGQPARSEGEVVEIYHVNWHLSCSANRAIVFASPGVVISRKRGQSLRSACEVYGRGRDFLNFVENLHAQHCGYPNGLEHNIYGTVSVLRRRIPRGFLPIFLLIRGSS